MSPAALAATVAPGGAAEALAALVRLVLLARGLGPAAGVVLALAGCALLTVAGRLRRPTAALGGAAVAALAAHLLRGLLVARLGLSPAAVAGLAAAAGAVAGGVFPPLFPAGAGALAGAAIGAHLPLGGRALLGAGAGAVAVGALGLLGARAISVTLASSAGALALGAGLLAVGGAHPLAVELALRPFALVGFSLVAAIAGAAFQLSREPGLR